MNTIDIEVLFKNYGPAVVRKCKKYLHNPEDIKEAFQETFIAAAFYLKPIFSPYAFLMDLAKKKCCKILRQYYKKKDNIDYTVDVDILEDRYSFEELTLKRDEKEYYYKLALDNIKNHEEISKLLAIEEKYHDLKDEEIARILGVSLHKIRNMRQKFKKALKRVVKNQENINKDGSQ